MPDAGLVTVFYRDGSGLRPVAREPGQVLEYLLSRIDALGGPTIGYGVHAQGTARCPLPGGEVPIEISLLRGDRGISVTLTPRPVQTTVARLEAMGMNPIDTARLRGALEVGAGLVLVCGPRRSGGSASLAALAAITPLNGSRLLAFEPGPSAPLPAATRLHLPVAQSLESWEEIVLAQDVDVVVLDEVLMGASITGVLSTAGSRRLLLVRTDWSDSFAMLDHLLAQPQGRTVLAGRLLAIIQQRGVRSRLPVEGFSALFEVLHVTDALRAAFIAGADGQRLRQLATQDGFVSLADRARERVDAGTLSAIEAARALT
jgi:type II secretory ATPase GspE/PulE/Tfp pilus assembly ATPase PilB-like protein